MNNLSKLVLVSAKVAATTYTFETQSDGFKSWALCTVNDQTGELLITSDFGSWSHRWSASPSTLGHPTLTAFIGTRGDVDYIARKLQRDGRGGMRLSEDGTAKAFRRLLCARRLADGREQLEMRLETGLPLFSCREVPSPTWQDSARKDRLLYLTADVARRLQNEVDATVGECSPNVDLMFDRLLRLSGFADYITEEPWEYMVTELTPEDRALRDVVLPALIEACKATVAAREGSSS